MYFFSMCIFCSFLANQKARNTIVGAENLLKADKPRGMLVEHENTTSTNILPTSQVVYQRITHRNVWSIFPWVYRHNNTQLIDQSERAH